MDRERAGELLRGGPSMLDADANAAGEGYRAWLYTVADDARVAGVDRLVLGTPGAPGEMRRSYRREELDAAGRQLSNGYDGQETGIATAGHWPNLQQQLSGSPCGLPMQPDPTLPQGMCFGQVRWSTGSAPTSMLPVEVRLGHQGHRHSIRSMGWSYSCNLVRRSCVANCNLRA